MIEQGQGDREQVSVADLVAGDWIDASDEAGGEPEQFLWRTGERSPDGRFSWSLKTTGGLRHFGHDDLVSRVAHTEPLVTADLAVVDREDPLAAVRVRALEEERSAETSLFRAVLIDAAVAVPFFIALWVGLVVFAVGDKSPEWGPWLAIAVLIGTLNGVFFGALAGFITKAHVLDDVDHHVREMMGAARGEARGARPDASST